MHGTFAKTLRRPLLAAAFLVLAACGVGSTSVPVYVEGIVGPGGGTLETQGAFLQIPPGAFTEDTVCAIVPGPADLPIDPAAGEIDLLPGCMCFGPRGTPLLVDGFLRLCYDPNDVPKGSSLDDLVLLEWDEALGFLVVTPASHDTKTHCFEDAAYDELGYVVVGLRIDVLEFEFVFYGEPTPVAAVAPQGIFPVGPAVVLADGEGLLAPLPMTGTADANRYLPSFDGSRVLFTRSNVQTEGTSLHTVDAGLTAPHATREVLPEQTFQPSDGLYGWLGAQDRVFHSPQTGFAAAVEPQGTVAEVHFSYRAGDGTGPVVNFASKSAFFTFLNDVRISPDRSMVLLRWTYYGDGFFSIVDVIDATDGTPIGTNIPAYVDPFAPGNLTPRWLPDSSGVYFVESDGVTVTRLDPDGSNAATLYTLTAPSSVLVDFVVAPPFPPAAQRCAFVRRDFSKQVQGQAFGQGGGPDSFDTDTLAGTDPTTLDLGDFVQVEEMVPVFSDGAFQESLVLVQMSLPSRFGGPIGEFAVLPTVPDQHTLVFDLAGQSLVADLPTPLSHVDLSRGAGTEGRPLAWIPFTDPAYPEYPTPGIYLLDTLFGNPVNVTPAGWDVLAPPRWLASWRTTPGFDSFYPRVR